MRAKRIEAVTRRDAAYKSPTRRSGKEAALTLRSLRKERSFTLLSVTLLALGIGFASAVFTLLWQAVYAQLPVPDPARVYAFSSNVTHNGRSDSDARAETLSSPTYRYLAAHMTGGAGVIARHGETVNLQTPSGAGHLLVDFVSGNYFQVLGLKAAIGRTFSAQNDTFSSDRFTAILSYDFWQEAYGGEISAWNSVLQVNGVSFRIIGVAAPGFHGLIGGKSPKAYLPLTTYADLNPGWHGYQDWALRWLNPFVRLPAGVSAGMAEAKLQPVYRAAVRGELASEGAQEPEYLKKLSHERMALVPASQGAHGQIDNWGEPLRILQWMTLAVLSLAAINVAGLAVARAVRKRQEVLIRYAVGATRSAVMRLQFMQTLALSIAGGLIGIWIARWGSQALVHLAGLDHGNPFVYRPSGPTMLLHWAAVAVTGFLVGILPAWQATNVDLAAGLSAGALTHSATRSQAVTRRLLAAMQIALSLMLVIAAGLFSKSLHRLVTTPVGFHAEHLAVFSIDPKVAHSNVERTELLWSNLAERLRRQPGVSAVTYGTGGPFPQGADVALVAPDAHAAPTNHHQSGIRSIIGPGYFTALGIPVVAGREFDARDRANTAAVVIVNESFARRLFGKESAVGKTVSLFNGLDPNWSATVVGVIADHHQSWRRSAGSLLYTPALQTKRLVVVTYYVRTRFDTLPQQIIRKIVSEEAPSISAFDVSTMNSRMQEFASGDRALAILVATFAGLALIIAAVGVYGVVAYGAALRTMEFGVRVSVGASPFDILKLVLQEAALILASGVALAVPLTYFALSIARHQLQGISFAEPLIYLGAAVLLALCILSAALVPARRATRMSLNAALRHGSH